MTDPSGPGDDPDDAAALARYTAGLAAAAETAIPGWVERSVRHVLAAQGLPYGDDVAAQVTAAGQEAQESGRAELRALLALDIDEQRTNPLSILRSLVRYPTGVLRSAAAQPVVRDDFVVRNFPDDVYDLSPAAFADVDPALHELGLMWGAAKAHIHLARRRRREGRKL